MRCWILTLMVAAAGCSGKQELQYTDCGGSRYSDPCGAVIAFRTGAPAGESVSGLSKQGPAAIPILIYLMTGESTQTAIAAAEEIAKLGAESVPALTALLKSKAPHRGWAAWALGEIGPPARDAREALQSAESDPALRVAAGEALRKIGE
ncbi:MAG: HEAT repeat domain-containing protein [Planctomycetota bacterium]